MIRLDDLVARLRLDNREYTSGIAEAERSSSHLSRVAGAAATGMKILGAGLLTAGVAGATMGLKTAAGMEQARISFTTMLGSAAKADRFIRQLAAFAAKTPFDFPGLQQSASSLISAGINASKVIPIMRTLGDVTSGMGTGAEGIQRATIALQQMNAAQRITAEDLNQLRDAGVPVYDLLASALGKTKQQVVELATSGGLGKDALDAMMSALQSGKGLERFNGLMEKQSQSLKGLWSTLKDTVNMSLAQMVQPAVPTIKRGLASVTAGVAAFAAGVTGNTKQATGGFGAFGAAIRKHLPAIKEFVSAAWDKVRSSLQGISWKKVSDGLSSIGTAVSENKDSLGAFGGLLNVTGHALKFVADHADLVVKALPALAAGFVLVKVAQLAANVAASVAVPVRIAEVVATRAQTAAVRELAVAMRGGVVAQAASNTTTEAGVALSLRQRAAAVASAVATRLSGAATKAYAGAQWVLNAAMSANPIGIVVVALAAIAAGLIYAYKHSETFRNIVGAAFDGVKAAASAVAHFFTHTLLAAIGDFVSFGIKGFRFYLNAWLTVVGGILHGATAMFGWVPGLGDKLKGATAAFDKMKNGILGTLERTADAAGKWGEDTGQGFADGIRDKVPAVSDAARELATTTHRSLDNVLRFGSPSKEMRKLGRWVSQGFAHGITDSADSAASAMRDLAQRVRDLPKKTLGDPQRSAIVEYVQRQSKHLQELIRRRDGLLAQLDKAKERLADLRGQRRSEITNVTSTFQGLGNVVGLANAGGEAGVGGIKSRLAELVTRAVKFAKFVRQMRHRKYDPRLVAQVAEAGPIDGYDAAEALATASTSDQADIQGLEHQLTAAGKAAGTVTADALFGPGIAAAEGLVRGLKARTQKVRDAVADLVRTIVREVRHRLGIASPSRVMAGLGAQVSHGFAAGIAAAAPNAHAAMRALTAVPAAPQLAGALAAGARGGNTYSYDVTAYGQAWSADEMLRELSWQAKAGAA